MCEKLTLIFITFDNSCIFQTDTNFFTKFILYLVEATKDYFLNNLCHSIITFLNILCINFK